MKSLDGSTNDAPHANPKKNVGNGSPTDPSNTSNIGQKVETGVVSKEEGISEQSAEWEDIQERGLPSNSAKGDEEHYLKNPSPEDRGGA